MNKELRIILIILIAVFSAEVLLINSAFAQDPNILVEIWEKEKFQPLEGRPIFSVSNFLPGETKTERIRVTNNTPQNQWVGLKVINFDRGCVDNYCLADKLNLTVIMGDSSLYSGSLTDFYQSGEIPLSEVGPNGEKVEYDFSVNFVKETSEKEYQGSVTTFDLEIGFFRRETISAQPPGQTIAYIPPIPGVVTSIIIAGPINVTSESATISWTTDIDAFCRVIYDTVSHLILGNPPNYGYAFSTEASETKTKSHQMTLTNLEPATTYFYRVVCWASPLKISPEYSFTTLAIKPKERIPGEVTPERRFLPKEEMPEEIEGPLFEEFRPEEIPQKEIISPEKTLPPLVERPKEGLGSMLLASLADSWQDFQKGQLFTNPIFWALIASFGFLFSGLSLIDKPRILFGVLGLIGIFAILFSSFFLPLPIVEQLRFPLPNFLSYSVGILLFIIGILIISLAVKTLSLKTASNLAKSKILVTSGIYRVVRHPLYLGLIIAYLGWCFIFKGLPAILFSPIVFIFLLILIFFEERDLIKIYGESYQEYKRQVRWRIIPALF